MNEYCFADLPIGKRETLVVTVGDADVLAFAQLSGDQSAIHVDDEYAKSRAFRRRLVHGMLSGAYLSGFLGMKLPGKHGLLQSIECQFPAPCYVPSVLTIEGVVVRRTEALRVVTVELSIIDQAGTVTARAKARSALKQ